MHYNKKRKLIRAERCGHLIITHMIDKTGMFNKTGREVLQSKSLTKIIKLNLIHHPTIPRQKKIFIPIQKARESVRLCDLNFLNFPHYNLIENLHFLSYVTNFSFFLSENSQKK